VQASSCVSSIVSSPSRRRIPGRREASSRTRARSCGKAATSAHSSLAAEPVQGGATLLLAQLSRCAVPLTPDCMAWPVGCAPKFGRLQHGHAARPVRWFGDATLIVLVRLVLRLATVDGPRFGISSYLPGTAIG
jgi:hypothetical protein